MIENFPKNALVTATHGSYFIPKSVRGNLAPEFKENSLRLVRNFSDYETRKLLPEAAPIEQKITAWFSRAIGDPNRAPDADDIFRDTDFNGNPIWNKPLTEKQKAKLLKLYYHQYHVRVASMIKQANKSQQDTILFDIHDTGNLMLGSKPEDDHSRENKFPEICIGNCNGASCSPEIFELFAKNLQDEFNCDIAINNPYAGGYVAQEYSKMCNTIQIEFDRSTLNELNQRMDFKAVALRANKLQNAIIRTARKFEV